MSLFHDNIITKYEADMNKRQLTLWTVWEENGPDQELTQIIFTEVEDHVFMLGNYHCNMIFDIEEVDLSLFWENNRNYILENWQYGSPSFVDGSPEKKKILQYMQREKLRYFTIDASLGLCGWVLAKGVKVICNGEEINVFELK